MSSTVRYNATKVTTRCRAAERARDEARAIAKQAGRGEEAGGKRAAEAEAATTAARAELDGWRAKAYGLQSKVGAAAMQLLGVCQRAEALWRVWEWLQAARTLRPRPESEKWETGC